MMLGDDVTAALPELRAHAESLMVDACTITRGGEPVWDDASGTYTPGTGTTVYDGPCRVRMPSPDGSETASGEATWSLRGAFVSVPIDTSAGVRVGDVVTVTSSVHDPALVGQPFTVTGLHSQTFSTARRLKCEAVDRDA